MTIIQRETVIGPGRISVWAERLDDNNRPIPGLKRERELVASTDDIPLARARVLSALRRQSS